MGPCGAQPGEGPVDHAKKHHGDRGLVGGMFMRDSG